MWTREAKASVSLALVALATVVPSAIIPGVAGDIAYWIIIPAIALAAIAAATGGIVRQLRESRTLRGHAPCLLGIFIAVGIAAPLWYYTPTT